MLKTLLRQTPSCSDPRNAPLTPPEALGGSGFPMGQDDVADTVVFGTPGCGKSSGFAGTIALSYLNAAFGRSATATKDKCDQANVLAQDQRFLS